MPVLRRVYIVHPVTPHMQVISLTGHATPTTLLEEESWKGISGIPIKFVGTQFSAFMHKLKQDKLKALWTANSQVWWELPEPAANFYSIYKWLHYRVGRDSNSSWCIIIWVITWQDRAGPRGIHVTPWHSRPGMRLYKHTDLYIVLLLNNDLFQMASLMPATAAKNKTQESMIGYYCVNL